MLGVTADTNIYIYGFEFGGLPRRFVNFAAAGEFRLDISDAILNEMLRVLREKFFWDAERLRVLEEDVRSYASFVIPRQPLNVMKTDPSDNRILECAAAAKSDFIVSGDFRHVLPVGSFEGIKIVTAAQFLKVVEQRR